MAYLVNYKEFSEFVGDVLVRPGITKVKKADVSGVKIPSGVELCESLDDVRWGEFPLAVRRAYAEDDRYRKYFVSREELDPNAELRQAIERMNSAQGR